LQKDALYFRVMETALKSGKLQKATACTNSKKTESNIL
jgi:hypothetical protein